MRASESKASVDDKRSRTSSGGSAKRTSTAVTKNAEKQHEPGICCIIRIGDYLFFGSLLDLLGI